MIFTKRWLALFLIGAIPIALTGTAWSGIMEYVAIAWYFALIIAALADRLMTVAPADISVDRELGEKLTLGSANSISLRVRNHSNQLVRLTLIDAYPESMFIGESEEGSSIPPTTGSTRTSAEIEMEMEPRSRRTATYTITPTERGDHRFGDIYMTVRGKLGMIQRLRRFDASATVKVYPNLANAAQFDLMARRGKLQQIGIRKTRLQGIGRDFESLRDYLPDDEMRRIDWKATARRGKLVSRQYEVERSQAVIIVLDVGRTMLTEIAGVQKLDYAINASLLLAYVATLSDDLVGLLVFSDRVHTFLPPRRGRAQVYAILDHLYNARASLAEADYQSALAYLQTRWRKRALMVCFMDLWDADSARQTISELAILQPRHLVAAVTLLDPAVVAAVDQQITDPQSAYRKAAAIQVVDERDNALASLTKRGVLVVDSPADCVSIALVNRYLEIKDRMML